LGIVNLFYFVSAIWGCVSAMKLSISIVMMRTDGLTIAYIRNPSFPSSAILPRQLIIPEYR
jgi:hypothetical protein